MANIFAGIILLFGVFTFQAVGSSLDSFTNGLVAYFPLDGDAKNQSGGGLPGLLHNVSVTADRFGAAAHALAFNGTNSFIDFDAVPTSATEELSILCWLRPDKLPQFGLAVCLGYNDGNLPCDGFSVGIGDALIAGQFGYIGNKILGLNACVAWVDGGGLFEQTNRWYAVGMTRALGTNYYYLNGVLVSETRISSPSPPSHFRIGSQIPTNLPQTDYSVFKGAIDTVRIYDRALSTSEIKTLYSLENALVPRAAKAVPEIVNGFLVGLKLIDGGGGYTNAPDVLVISDQGSGASVKAVTENGSVTGFIIESAGLGYSNDASIVIASPPFLPELKIRVSRVFLDLKVVAGKKYQIESSPNFSDWTVIGNPFTAQAEALTEEFPVENNSVYFRVQQLP